MSSLRFTHDTLAQRVVFNTGQAVHAVVDEVTRLGAGKPMIISTEGTHEVAETLAAVLPPVQHWRDAVQHVPRKIADAATAAARESEADVLISIGGGSATGLAKAIALDTSLPIIAVPTTYAASEATPVWGITEERTKTTGIDPIVLPTVVIYDADLVATLPQPMAIASGLNAMAHCVDSLWAPKADPINRAYAIESARALAHALPGLATGGGQDAREQALYGCYLSGVAFASAGSGLHHKICHVLGGTFNLPHAQTHAVVLRYVAALNLPAVPDTAADLAQALDTDDALAGLTRLYQQVGAPASLAELGMAEDGIAEAVDRVLAAVPAGNPAEVTEDNLTALLTAAYHGDDPTSLSQQPVLTEGLTR
jgi:maleylacetate reductase